MNKLGFASDNYAGLCPEAWDAMQRANDGYASAYGEDDWTQRASDSLRRLFETDCEVFFVFNGTAANALAVASLCRSYHSVLCHELAHIETDECGSPEFFTHGTKILTVPGAGGKLKPASLEHCITRREDIHYPKPRVISMTQPTELETLYTMEELTALRDLAAKYNMKIHMDGARFANAVAAMDRTPAELTWKAGVDVLCFGGIKNGISMGEAVVFFDRDAAYEFDYRCKQAGQLASKMRFITAPWAALLDSGAWLKRARHANAMAKLLEKKVAAVDGVEVVYPCETNAVFLKMAPETAEALRAKGWHFYGFIGEGNNRFMCSWATTEEEIDALMDDLR